VNRIDGIRLKIERAKEHIRNLDLAIQTFVCSEPYAIRTKPHSVIQHTTLYVARAEPVPTTVPIILGDAIHNLRSALDHLAWQLVEADGGIPDKHTFFPIFSGPDGFQKYASAMGSGEIKKIRPGAEKVIQAMQPYVTGDDTLGHISQLDIIDKHRFVLTTVMLFKAWHVSVNGMTLPFPQVPRVLILGDEFTNIPTSTYERQAHEDFKLGIDVAFGEPEIIKGKPVLETVNNMADLVSSIIPNFEPFLL
jgi:hypothetical protein